MTVRIAKFKVQVPIYASPEELQDAENALCDQFETFTHNLGLNSTIWGTQWARKKLGNYYAFTLEALYKDG